MNGGNVMVRQAHLDEHAAWLECLAPFERERAQSMPPGVLRQRFIVSRGLRRRVLSECLGTEPCSLEFDNEPGGKPRLLKANGWNFNVSHSGDYVAVAVGRQRLGLDMEAIRPIHNMSAIARRCFHCDEIAAWETLPQERREEGFFILWSAREAALKCAGLGLAKGITITKVEPSILKTSAGNVVVGNTTLRLQRLESHEGYVMTLAEEWAPLHRKIVSGRDER